MSPVLCRGVTTDYGLSGSGVFDHSLDPGYRTHLGPGYKPGLLFEHHCTTWAFSGILSSGHRQPPGRLPTRTVLAKETDRKREVSIAYRMHPSIPRATCPRCGARLGNGARPPSPACGPRMACDEAVAMHRRINGPNDAVLRPTRLGRIVRPLETHRPLTGRHRSERNPLVGSHGVVVRGLVRGNFASAPYGQRAVAHVPADAAA